jgi:hypothetical protein
MLKQKDNPEYKIGFIEINQTNEINVSKNRNQKSNKYVYKIFRKKSNQPSFYPYNDFSNRNGNKCQKSNPVVG